MSANETPGPAASLVGQTFLSVSRLHGRLLTVHDRMARTYGLTAARWQILETIAERPRAVSELARHLGTRRQSTQRITDPLVDAQLSETVAAAE